MINKRDRFVMRSDTEKSKCKFSHCQGCLFYEYSEEAINPIFIEENNKRSSLTDAHNLNHERQPRIISAIGSKNNSYCPCELVGEYEFFRDGNSNTNTFSYNPQELESYCELIRSVVQIECGRQRVSEGIGDHYKINTIQVAENGDYIYKIEESSDEQRKDRTANRWEPTQPVFISAQTGRGKNYFIENELLPHIKELNREKRTKQKALIISNRLALKKQIKNRIEGNDYDNEDDHIYPYAEYADTITYQGFLNRVTHFDKVQKNRNSSYIYIICDEAHFFTSDAMFNPHTKKILSAIVRTFQNAIRAYMSATPYECFKYIYECERTTYPDGEPFAFYHFKRDYSYLNTRYYTGFEELKGLIVESVNNKKEKWLIFIDDKDQCQALKSELIEHGNDSGYPMVIEPDGRAIDKILAVDATSKKDKAYQDMVLNERLNRDTYVLISTSVLDNGVNLTGIENIVISDPSKIKSLQMLGRARVADKEDSKTLYIKRFDEGYISKRIEGIEKQRDAYHSYDLAYEPVGNRGYSEYSFLNKYYNDDHRDWIDAKHWFGRPLAEPTKLYPNDIARSLVDTLSSVYKLILEEMRTTDDEEGKVKGQRYLEYQLSWFGKQYDEEEDITLTDKNEGMNQFIKFLESYANDSTEMKSDNDKLPFKKEFTLLHDRVFPQRSSVKDNKGRDTYGITIMNRVLEEQNMNYKIESDKKTSVWKVVRFGRESDDGSN